MTTATRRLQPIATLTTIDWKNEALSVVLGERGTATIVRRTQDGQFAVLAIAGIKARIIKILPTLERARAYNFAIAR
jgi:hypothetical protein